MGLLHVVYAFSKAKIILQAHPSRLTRPAYITVRTVTLTRCHKFTLATSQDALLQQWLWIPLLPLIPLLHVLLPWLPSWHLWNFSVLQNVHCLVLFQWTIALPPKSFRLLEITGLLPPQVRSPRSCEYQDCPQGVGDPWGLATSRDYAS